jgi:glycosyltransferase involved in cell wall biosynthesis
MKPLVSILIPAYNAEQWIAETIQSAINQTWQNKEIIVVDDGSHDHTAEVARQFSSKGVVVMSTKNQGAAAARNHALQLSQGDYIQWLDADDLLSPDKIELQLEALGAGGNKKVLLSSAWAYFNYRTQRARFNPTSLWHDQLPVEWLIHKMAEGPHMQTATWLTSRELSQAAGPWDIRQLSDDDGEYYCRVLLATESIRFVPEAKVFYRMTPTSRLSYVGNSDKKKNALLASIKLYIGYLRSMEESERVRKACLKYLHAKSIHFCPERPDIIAELQGLAAELGGHLEPPRLRWKFAWMQPVFGLKFAKQAQMVLPQLKASLIRSWDKTMYRLESRAAVAGDASNAIRRG